MECELCGKKTDEVFLVEVENVKLYVCKECKKYGRELNQENYKKDKVVLKFNKLNIDEENVEIVENFAEIIKRKREEMKMTQKQFGMFLNEKETFIHKIESGEIVPPLDVVKKFEKKLGIKLTTEKKVGNYQNKPTKSEGLTLGDLLSEKLKNIKK
ncbi:MAG: multiprotein bridging factor aMBF1 [Candidatus Woesearchaeota archaeon]